MSITAMKQWMEALEWAESLVNTSDRSCQDAAWAIAKAIPSLRTAIQEAESVEPYGWMVEGVPTVMRGSLGEDIQKSTAKRIGGTCKAFPVYLAPPQAQPAKPKWNVLMVTTAYEQGVGKGIQAKQRDSEIDNPYIEGECREAWGLGYQEGKDKAQPAKPPSDLLTAFDTYARQFTYRNHPAEPKHFPKGFPWFEAGFLAAAAQPFQPDWVSYRQGKEDGKAEAQQPLTDEQIISLMREASKGSAINRNGSTSLRFARAIEAAHNIKEQLK